MGFELYPALDTRPRDLRITKIKYSAFIEGSSDIDAKLKSRGIDTVLIAGTATNVCCESSARDAMMLDYRVIMLSDATATFDSIGPNGKRYGSELVHDVALADLNGEFSTVVDTNTVLERAP